MELTTRVEVFLNEEEIETICKAQEIFAKMANALDDNGKKFSDIDVTYENFITDGVTDNYALRDNFDRALHGLTVLVTHLPR